MKGSSSRINVGTYDNDKITGSVKVKFKFLKNSISSKRFNIIPKERKIKIVLIIILKYPRIKYLFIILFIMIPFQNLLFLVSRHKKEQMSLQVRHSKK